MVAFLYFKGSNSFKFYSEIAPLKRKTFEERIPFLRFTYIKIIKFQNIPILCDLFQIKLMDFLILEFWEKNIRTETQSNLSKFNPFLRPFVVALLRAWQPSGSTNGQRTFLGFRNRFLASWPNFSSQFLSRTCLTGQTLSRWSLPGHPGLGQFLLPLSYLFSFNPLSSHFILRFITDNKRIIQYKVSNQMWTHT